MYPSSIARPLTVVAPLLDLCSRLAGNQSPATHGAHRVPGGGALDAVPLPGFLPKDEDGDAGEDAAEQAAQPAALAHVVSVALDETARDTRPTQAWSEWIMFKFSSSRES